MRNSLSRFTLCAALGLSACTAIPPPRLPAGTADASKACADWRWIGISRPAARCPEIAGWAVRPLFPQVAPVPAEAGCAGAPDEVPNVPSPELIRELSRFCVYEIADAWKGKGKHKGLQDLPFPPAVSSDLVRFDQDCAALALTDTVLAGRPGEADAKTFLAHAAGLAESLDVQGQLGVRLTFLDTQPTGDGVPSVSGRSKHGYTLAWLAHDLVCTPGSPDRCAARIATRLALPILEFDAHDPKRTRIDRERGGGLGMQSDLAEAIRNEVDAWWPTRATQRHLILNLSMAWDGTLFGGLDARQVADMRAGTQAVYRALQYAQGFDVLVLAAAGNQKRDPCVNVGPLLPAAWEAGAPSEESCRQDGRGPVIYAVGGVDAAGSPLANSRPAGMPRRAAYGMTGRYVGTSVAAAVASSIAAVVWDTFPDLSSRCVMQVLDGVELDPGCRLSLDRKESDDGAAMKADFWYGMGSWTAEAPAVRNLTLCAVLTEACRGPASVGCPLRSACLPASGARSVRRETTVGAVANLGSCQPWLYPQPEDDPCPACPPPGGKP